MQIATPITLFNEQNSDEVTFRTGDLPLGILFLVLEKEMDHRSRSSRHISNKRIVLYKNSNDFEIKPIQGCIEYIGRISGRKIYLRGLFIIVTLCYVSF